MEKISQQEIQVTVFPKNSVKSLCLGHLILCKTHKFIRSISPSIKSNISLSTYMLILNVRVHYILGYIYYQIKRLSNFLLLCHPVWLLVKFKLWEKNVSLIDYIVKKGGKKGSDRNHHIHILHIIFIIVRNLFPEYIPVLISSFSSDSTQQQPPVCYGNGFRSFRHLQNSPHFYSRTFELQLSWFKAKG